MSAGEDDNRQAMVFISYSTHYHPSDCLLGSSLVKLQWGQVLANRISCLSFARGRWTLWTWWNGNPIEVKDVRVESKARDIGKRNRSSYVKIRICLTLGITLNTLLIYKIRSMFSCVKCGSIELGLRLNRVQRWVREGLKRGDQSRLHLIQGRRRHKTEPTGIGHEPAFGDAEGSSCFVDHCYTSLS